DLIWSFIRCGLLVFYWFNPLVWVAAIMSKRDCELACDYGVIKELDEGDRLTYGKTLVDLISQRGQKNNVLCIATTMYGSAKGIKERITMIAKNKKMKATTLFTVLLIMILSAGCTFTTAETNDTNINDFATKWADAFSQRDARTIFELCENEELYLTIGSVAENGQYWMGSSSPWPWNKDYIIDKVDSSTIEIYYYFRTSSPTIYVAKETVAINKIEGEYKATGDSWKHFDTIESKADFDEAYKYGFPDFTEFAAAYQFQADDDANYSWGRKEILENPETAAIDQLNLAGAKVTGIHEEPYINKAVIKFSWNDGEAVVNLIQPMLTDENGDKRQATIWIVINESDLNDIDNS
ncbi:MAG: M56 family metallopeptidase, partial [Desulfotomaculaceae bacterium]|nr:M56 family metallopeptidase [Desulfotomaculaceae bacterium]